MGEPRALGPAAEAEAERLLRGKGYRILARNLRLPGGEIDLVAEAAGVLVFVEVKARRSAAFGGARYAVDGRKRTRLIRLAAQYLAQRRLQNQPCRFDVVLCHGAVAWPDRLEHIENAFQVPEDDLRW
ncbi:YraN family protein [Nitrospira sp. Kam-Ns4a]